MSMNAVARRAGVGIASVYDYFAKKESLLDAVVDTLTERNFERLEAKLDSLADEPLDATVEAMFEEFVDTYLEHPQFMVAVVESIFRLGLEGKVLEYRDRFAIRLAQHAHPELSPLPMAEVERSMRLVCDILMGVMEAEVLRGDPDVPRIAEELRRVVDDIFARLHERRAALLNAS